MHPEEIAESHILFIVDSISERDVDRIDELRFLAHSLEKYPSFFSINPFNYMDMVASLGVKKCPSLIIINADTLDILDVIDGDVPAIIAELREAYKCSDVSGTAMMPIMQVKNTEPLVALREDKISEAEMKAMADAYLAGR